MKLIEGELKETYKVHQKKLPLRIDRRLEALGMTSGTKIEVVHKKKHGAMVIRVRGTRFAIGRHIAENIEVEGAV